ADGMPKISGFGRAELLRSSPPITGQPGSSASEGVAARAEPIGPAADVFGLGALLQELLTGQSPVTPDDKRVTPEPLRQARPELPRALEAICLRCLDPDPAGRYPSAAALAEDLRRFRSGEVLFIDDLDDWSQQQRWARRAGYEILEVLGRGPE